MRAMKTTLAAVVAVIHVFLNAPLCAQPQTSEGARTITQEELRHHLYFLASDSLNGRVVGSPGFATAAVYAASQFRSSGLSPALADARGDSTYLQVVPFAVKTATDTGKLLVKTPAGEIAFAEFEDFIFAWFRSSDYPHSALPVVFVGYGIHEPSAGWDDYRDLDIKGKVALLLLGSPHRDGTPLLPDSLDVLYSNREGSPAQLTALLERKPAAVIALADSSIMARWDQYQSRRRNRITLYGGTPFVIGPDERRVNRGGSQIIALKSVFEGLFKDQKYSPVSEEGARGHGYATFELSGLSMKYDPSPSGPPFDSWNVVGIVRGTDPALRNEYITVGAHLDHIGPRNGAVCNGADDNASGSSALLEIAEATSLHPTRRSVAFVLYTAEESGLIGSMHFVDRCPFPLDKIVANINLDMIGRTGKGLEGRAHYVVDAASIRPEFATLITEVNAKTVRWPLVFETIDHFGGSSDQASFQRKGIPAAFFFSGEHEDLHQPTDDPEKIDFDKMEHIAQLVYEIVQEMGNRKTVF